jgi:serine/threonine-protein kinase
MNQLGSIQLREGDLLAGKYRIGRVLGVGGMGVVVAARHEQLEQMVAIKFVKDDALDNDEAVERFLREARSAARLKSEHVARVLDVGRLESGAPYMVMEFLEGSDLAQALTKDGPMAVDLAAALMLQVCEAVAEAHAAGIVHRDLKPENLFLTRTVGGSPKMKVLDFGVSKTSMPLGDPSAKLTRTRAMLGSPLYMAPEQLRSSRDVDSRTDVWSLGVVLFELLSGRSPFEADAMPELCLKIVNEPPLSLAQLRPMVPLAIVAIVERCLEKDRTKRFDNAAELALALEPFAPPRSSMFSVRPSFEALRNTPGLHASVPSATSFAGPFVPASSPSTTSIPAAWGTEGQRVSQQAPARRRGGAGWVIGVLLVLGAAGAAFALRPTAGPRVEAATGQAAPAPHPPPAATELSPLPAPAQPEPIVVEPPAAPLPAQPAQPSDSNAHSSALAAVAPPVAFSASEPRRPVVPSVPVAALPRPAPASAPASVPSRGADDDIPSLR